MKQTLFNAKRARQYLIKNGHWPLFIATIGNPHNLGAIIKAAEFFKALDRAKHAKR